MKKGSLLGKISAGLAGLSLLLALTGCGKEAEPVYVGQSLVSGREVETLAPEDKYRTYYEIFVGSFRDSDNDGKCLLILWGRNRHAGKRHR